MGGCEVRISWWWILGVEVVCRADLADGLVAPGLLALAPLVAPGAAGVGAADFGRDEFVQGAQGGDGGGDDPDAGLDGAPDCEVGGLIYACLG